MIFRKKMFRIESLEMEKKKKEPENIPDFQLEKHDKWPWMELSS